MDHIPSVELLEATHQFPGSYKFKVIGHAQDEFVERVVACVRDALLLDADPPYGTRHTTGGSKVSVTLEPTVVDAAQVQAIYRRIGELPGLIVLW